jgi:hypothetical protein
MKPSLYIGIDGSSISKYCPTFYKRTDISSEYLYVLEGYKNDDKHFTYKIFKNEVEQDYITVGKWKIINIRPSYKPSCAFLFDLVDPNGKSSEDNTFPYHQITKGVESFLFAKFIFNDDTGINDMMNTALQAHQYENWSDFVNNKKND